MGYLGAFFFFYFISCLFANDDPVGAKIRANRKTDYSEVWASLFIIVFVVVVWSLFGIVAVCVAPFFVAYGIYLWFFCKWIYNSIPKWHKKLGPTYKSVGSYFWDDDSI